MPAQQKRRILKEFRIDEISICDSPAQTHAKATLMKRADDRQQEDEMQLDKIASFEKFEDAVAALARAGNIPRHVAMQKARRRTRSLSQKYQSEGSDVAKAAADALAPRTLNKAAQDLRSRRRRHRQSRRVPA